MYESPPLLPPPFATLVAYDKEILEWLSGGISVRNVTIGQSGDTEQILVSPVTFALHEDLIDELIDLHKAREMRLKDLISKA